MPSSEEKIDPIYFNRELSWLAFNQRVLEQAHSRQYPILERLRFLAYVSSNLDEFYEIRVAGLMQEVDSNIQEHSIDGLSPKEQLGQIRKSTQELVENQYKCWHNEILPALQKEHIHIKSRASLSKIELEWLQDFFEKEIFPVLTPLAIDIAHPFPLLINKGLNIYVWLEDPQAPENTNITAVIPVPRILPRIIEIRTEGKGPYSYIFLSDILRDFAQQLFPGYTLKGAWEFRITRNSDLYINEEEVENLLKKIEEELYNMRRGAAVRLEIHEGMPEHLLNQLLKATNLNKEDVFQINGPLNLLRLFSLYDLLERPKLKFKVLQPLTPQKLIQPNDIFETIKEGDILLNHPYDSFLPVVEFIQQAAQDPLVFAIKQTLYRTSGDSPFIEALKDASRNGKQVTALIELKARFDEANNIRWARELEEEGVHVVYGLVGLKTHCKCSLVVRRDPDGLRHYAHLGTGNYNPKTAKYYTDLSLLTTKPELTQEIAALFNVLTGFAHAPKFAKLHVAPFNLHNQTQALINRETKFANQGNPARIIAKLNSLVDQVTINNLYKASQAGVKIDLIVRGICCLVPGVKGLSENIHVRSILGQFLEHSRFFYFENGDSEPDIYMGSADWMPRNFFRRIETNFPIEDPLLRKRMIEEIIPSYLKDNTQSKELDSKGNYQKISLKQNEQPFSAHKNFINLNKIHQLEQEQRAQKKPTPPHHA